jgi:hypothetical protein
MSNEKKDFLTGEAAKPGHGDSSSRLARVSLFRTEEELNRERFLGLVKEEGERMKRGVLVWENEEDEILYLPMPMSVVELVGLLEVAKEFIVHTYMMEG